MMGGVQVHPRAIRTWAFEAHGGVAVESVGDGEIRRAESEGQSYVDSDVGEALR